jgi:feruloyl esterase
MNEKNLPLDDFYRFFLIPGMQHCQESVRDAPWYIGGFQPLEDTVGVPGYQDESMMLSVRLWIGLRRVLLLTRLLRLSLRKMIRPRMLRRRPVCPCPQQTVYDGKGDVDDAASWHCEARSE